MKNTFAILLLAAASAVAPASAANVTLSAPGTASGTFDVFVNVSGVFDSPRATDSLLAYGFDFTYDSGLLSYSGLTQGSLFDDLSSNPGIGAQVAGSVVSTFIFLNTGDFTEPLNLAKLSFNVIGNGLATIAVSANSEIADQGLVYLGGSDSFSASTQVATSLAAPTPEPATFGIAGLALLALAAAARRRPA